MLRAFSDMLLGIATADLLPGEVVMLIRGRAKARAVSYEERAALAALVLSTRLDYAAKMTLTAEDLAVWFGEPDADGVYSGGIRANPKRLFDAWTGRASEEEGETEPVFYTPELDGEEVYIPE